MTKRAKQKLITAIREEVHSARLFAAMGFVMQMRRDRAGLSHEFMIDDPERQLEEFMGASSIRQLKLLREIALGLTQDEMRVQGAEMRSAG
jgi:hypothetical protein